jgi:small subunit ribosomal protein S20
MVTPDVAAHQLNEGLALWALRQVYFFVRFPVVFEDRDSMPNIKSVKKDVIRSRQRHERNVAAKSTVKTAIKKARTAVDAQKPADEVENLVRVAVKRANTAAASASAATSAA